MVKYTSRKSFLSSQNVDRRYLVQYVGRKMNNSVNVNSINTVINYLFEEIIADLKEFKIISIGNFGSFVIKKLLPRKHFDIYRKQIRISDGKLVLRFKLTDDIRSVLKNNLDFEKTFNKKND